MHKSQSGFLTVILVTMERTVIKIQKNSNYHLNKMLNPTCKYQIFPFLFCEAASDSSCQLKFSYLRSLNSLKMTLSDIQIKNTRPPMHHKKDKNCCNMNNT